MEPITGCCQKKSPEVRDMMFREGRDDRGGQIGPLPAFPGMQESLEVQPLPAPLASSGNGDATSFSPELAGSSVNSDRLENLFSGLASWAG